MKPLMMIVEDDEALRASLAEHFGRRGFEVVEAPTAAAAREAFGRRKIDLILMDLHLPDGDGMELFRAFRDVDPEMTAIIVTAFGDVRAAVEAMKAGAFDYVVKPFELDELKIVVDKALESRRFKAELCHLRAARRTAAVEDLIGPSAAMRAVREMIARVAGAPTTPVLVRGESGTGKELVADAIHHSSARAAAPLVKVNAAAIPESLMESELFGYEKGAFTDARAAKAGLFEQADGGTIFLDEVSELRTSLQPQLLRVIERQPFRRIGGSREIRADVRVIAATNRDLEKAAARGAFREDLLFRLRVFEIVLPPLRERREDVIPIAEHLLGRIARDLGRDVRGFNDEVPSLLRGYGWPGNVRELRNVLERAVILCDEPALRPEHLTAQLRQTSALRRYRTERGDELTLEALERTHIVETLEAAGGNKTEAARRLGISRNTLKDKLRRYGITPRSVSARDED